ncbi:MAG: ester cyclase [Anaerolineales bacterium]|nr:ester cyclase [Anaerolineales bacterium]
MPLFSSDLRFDATAATDYTNTMQSLDLISNYVNALVHQDAERMNRSRAAEFVLDWVHGDAYGDNPLSAEQAAAFWPTWFAAFPEMDYEVTRTVAADAVVVTQWTFTGTHSQMLGAPIFDEPLPPSGRTIRFRGVSIYDIAGDLIRRETMYLDLATLLVELGATP